MPEKLLKTVCATGIRSADPRRIMRREVLRALSGDAPLVRIEAAIEQTDPLTWLAAQPATERIYWADRTGRSSMAAAGAARVFSGERFEELESAWSGMVSLLEAGPAELRLYGGLRFDTATPADTSWEPFSAFRFVLPRFELHSSPGGCTLVCHVSPPTDREKPSDLLAAVDRIAFPEVPKEEGLPLPLGRRDEPGRAEWSANVLEALDMFRSGALEKVVLARKAAFDFPTPIDPLLLLKRLEPATPHCFHFCFQTGQAAFIGASPERLFRRSGRSIESEAVAGTRPRGSSTDDDARLSRELLDSEKDGREHEVVQRSILEGLHNLGANLVVDEHPSEMTLMRGRHLRSSIRGYLPEGVTDLDLLRALHPTPAVGGYPTHAAIEAIRSTESFDRGWYAGAVGRIGKEETEFAVGIRSGLVEGNRLSLFSGAGIVSGSAPDSEWNEIETKISDFVSVLGLDPHRS